MYVAVDKNYELDLYNNVFRNVRLLRFKGPPNLLMKVFNQTVDDIMISSINLTWQNGSTEIDETHVRIIPHYLDSEIRQLTCCIVPES